MPGSVFRRVIRVPGTVTEFFRSDTPTLSESSEGGVLGA